MQGGGGRARIPADRPGRAMTDRWGPMQAFHLPKDLLGGARSGILTEEEQAVLRWAVEENGGYLGLADLQGRLGMGHGRRGGWRRSGSGGGGWRRTRRGNRRRVSGEALAVLSDKATNPTNPDKA